MHLVVRFVKELVVRVRGFERVLIKRLCHETDLPGHGRTGFAISKPLWANLLPNVVVKSLFGQLMLQVPSHFEWNKHSHDGLEWIYQSFYCCFWSHLSLWGRLIIEGRH
jgi:hypothetical protein